jgi:hypothetical protein
VDDLIVRDRDVTTQTAGDLDTSFNGAGIVTTDMDGNRDLANTVAVQSDGKYVVAGSVTDGYYGGPWVIGVARYNTSQAFDPDLVKALIFSETQIGLDKRYTDLLSQPAIPQLMGNFKAVYGPWVIGGKKGAPPSLPGGLNQFNIGGVTDNNVFTKVISEFSIDIGQYDPLAGGNETDVRIAVGAVLEKLDYAAGLANNNNAIIKSDDECWFNAVVAFKGVSREGYRKAELVWTLFTTGVSPYPPRKKIW